jgi:predicted transcriptional regulator
MKTAVSIPDDLFQQAEKLAGELELSRSALYAKALREMIERLRDEAITAQINAAIAEAGPQAPDPFMQRAAYLTAKRAGGDW